MIAALIAAGLLSAFDWSDGCRPVAGSEALWRDDVRYVFVGERHFDQVMENVFGDRVGADRRDRRLLELLDDIPSLDPFLLREHLRRNGFAAAPCYFELSDGDLKRIFSFVESQVEPLVRLSLRGDIGLARKSHQAPLP